MDRAELGSPSDIADEELGSSGKSGGTGTGDDPEDDADDFLESERGLPSFNDDFDEGSCGCGATVGGGDDETDDIDDILDKDFTRDMPSFDVDGVKGIWGGMGMGSGEGGFMAIDLERVSRESCPTELDDMAPEADPEDFIDRERDRPSTL